jgi:hypothetical protein
MKVLVLIALFGVAAAAVTRAVNEELNEDWSAYKTQHGTVDMTTDMFVFQEVFSIYFFHRQELRGCWKYGPSIHLGKELEENSTPQHSC